MHFLARSRMMLINCWSPEASLQWEQIASNAKGLISHVEPVPYHCSMENAVLPGAMTDHTILTDAENAILTMISTCGEVQ